MCTSPGVERAGFSWLGCALHHGLEWPSRGGTSLLHGPPHRLHFAHDSMAGRRFDKHRSWAAVTPGTFEAFGSCACLGAYVLLQFSWWAYLLASTGGARERWMVLGEGSVFAALLVLGLMRCWSATSGKNALRLARERNLLLGVTHELKTPLASVQLGDGLVEALEVV